MDANIGRISEPTTAPTPLRPIKRARDEDESSFEDALEEQNDGNGPKPEPEPENDDPKPVVPPPSDGVGSHLDLTA